MLDGYQIDFLEDLWNDFESFTGEQPYGTGLLSRDLFQQNVNVALIAVDGSYQVLVRPREKCQGAFVPITEFIQPRWEAAVENYEELVCKNGSSLASEPGVQVLGGSFVISVSTGPQKAQNCASRCSSAQNVSGSPGFG